MSTVPMLDVVSGNVAGQQFYDGSPFPAVVVNQSPEASLDATVEWVQAHRARYIAAAELCGAVLIHAWTIAARASM